MPVLSNHPNVSDLRLIERDPANIKHVPQTEDAKALAVDLDPSTIQWIESPSPSLMERAFDLDPSTFKFFAWRAPEELRLRALNHDPSNIKYIRRPSLIEEKAVINVSKDSIDLIKEPSAAARRWWFFRWHKVIWI